MREIFPYATIAKFLFFYYLMRMVKIAFFRFFGSLPERFKTEKVEWNFSEPPSILCLFRSWSGGFFLTFLQFAV